MSCYSCRFVFGPWLDLDITDISKLTSPVPDLKPDNIMIKVEDPVILEESARDEYDHPLPQKRCSDGRTIYLSRNDFGITDKTTGIIQITDFDLSVRGDRPNRGRIQAEVYRSPEVLLGAGYSYSADIWSLGVMVSQNGMPAVNRRANVFLLVMGCS